MLDTRLSLLVPILFLIVGAAGKKLVRGSAWQRSDWYLGPEFSLSMIPTSLMFCVDRVRTLDGIAADAVNQIHASHVQIGYSLFTAAISLAVYIGLLSLHQDWEAEADRLRLKTFLLGIVSNGIALALFLSFSIYVQGI